MTKKQERKKKERERRVAQKKHAAAQKRAQEQSGSETPQTFPKTNVFTGTAAAPKPTHVTGNTKKPFNYRRTGG